MAKGKSAGKNEAKNTSQTKPKPPTKEQRKARKWEAYAELQQKG